MTDVITALRRDWTYLRDSRLAEAALRRWQTHEPALRLYRNLGALEADVHDRATPGVIVDEVFGALLRVHHHGDLLAGRVIVALLLPSLARHRRTGPSADEHLAQLLAELWYAIGRYPLRRRPRAIPANLTRDARQRAQRAMTAADTQPLPEQRVASDARHWAARADDRVDLSRYASDVGVPEPDLLLIAATRIGGWRVSDLADRAEAARLRQRRNRAETRLCRALPS